MPQNCWRGAQPSEPPLYSRSNVSGDDGSNLNRDSGDRVSHRLPDTRRSISAERNSHHRDYTSRDDHVLERHYPVLVLRESLHFVEKITHIKASNLMFS